MDISIYIILICNVCVCASVCQKNVILANNSSTGPIKGLSVGTYIDWTKGIALQRPKALVGTDLKEQMRYYKFANIEEPRLLRELNFDT